MGLVPARPLPTIRGEIPTHTVGSDVSSVHRGGQTLSAHSALPGVLSSPPLCSQQGPGQAPRTGLGLLFPHPPCPVALTVKGHVLDEAHVQGEALGQGHKVQEFVLIQASHHHAVYLVVGRGNREGQPCGVLFPGRRAGSGISLGSPPRVPFLEALLQFSMGWKIPGVTGFLPSLVGSRGKVGVGQR